MMRSMGVRPIDAPRGKGKGKAKKPATPPARPAAAPAAARPDPAHGSTPAASKAPAGPARPAAARPGAAPVGKAPTGTAPAGKAAAGKAPAASARPAGKHPAGRPTAGPGPSGAARGGDTALLLAEIDRLRAGLAELGPLREQLAAAQAALTAANARSDELGAQLAAAQAQAGVAAQQAATAQAAHDELHLALARLSDQGQGPQPLLAALRQRGVYGETEAEQLLLGLAQERVLGPLLELLATPRPEAVARLLANRVLLTGDCPACPTLPGRVHLRLPAARCELCHGADLRRAVRRFYDGALVTGLTRLVVGGGTARDHLVLRGLLDDRRVELTLVHGGLRRTADEVALDLAAARAVVLWRHPDNEPDALLPYAAFPGPRVELEAPDLAAFLEAAGQGLQRALDGP